MWTCEAKDGELTYTSTEGYSVTYPVAPNPNLDEWETDQLVQCPCGKEYVVVVKGPPVTDMPGVMCPFCGAPANDYRSISTHSGGLFNATLLRP